MFSVEEIVATTLEIGRKLGPDRPLWHRGHTCPQHVLKASLPRQIEDAKKLLPLEQRLITRFRQRSLPYWPAGYPQNDWEQLFAMQHYGLPTRLLDWSENLFVALYFASLKHEHLVDGKPVDCPPILWILDPVGWNQQAQQLKGFTDVGILNTDAEDLKPYAPTGTELQRRYPQPLAIYGAHNSPRITAQRGTFTITGDSLESMETFAADHKEQSLWKLALFISREDLQRDLASLGFSESMIFPDLASVAKEVTAMEGLK
nr:FRG domain-containing protein [Intrasporangium chromatireducens]